MTRWRKPKNALLAAASIIAAATALAPVAAADFDPGVRFATTIEAPALDSAQLQHDNETAARSGKWAFLAIAAGGLAALVRLVGVRRLVSAASTQTVKTARAAAKAGASVARSAGRVIASPMRFLAVIAGLAIFVLAGIGLFDLEWLVGILTGAALTLTGVLGMWKTRRRRVRARAPMPSARIMDNGN